VARPALMGWSSTEQKSPDGAVQFEQRVSATRPLVELSERGALALGERYWQEVEACTHRLVRAHRRAEEIELRLLGRWPLLHFGRPRTVVDASGVLIRFPIVGGRLARSPGGSITFAQAVAPAIELRATIDGFYPRLSAPLYRHVQQRIHTSVSRRYFTRLLAEGPR
jgi:hypothetical protein